MTTERKMNGITQKYKKWHEVPIVGVVGLLCLVFALCFNPISIQVHVVSQQQHVVQSNTVNTVLSINVVSFICISKM